MASVSGAGPSGLLSGALLVLRILLAAFFVMAAARNLLGDAQIAADFQRWHYPGWFRVLTALLQVVGAVALLPPSTAFLGAGLLTLVMLGAVGTHLWHDPPASALPALVFLALVATLLYFHRPEALQRLPPAG